MRNTIGEVFTCGRSDVLLIVTIQSKASSGISLASFAHVLCDAYIIIIIIIDT